MARTEPRWPVKIGLLIGGLLAGFASMFVGGMVGGYVNLSWAAVALPIVVGIATMKRLPFFAWGVFLSMPLAILGAFVSCLLILSHYNK